MKAWSIIWGIFILAGIIGMLCGARWMWAIVFIAAIMFCGALSEAIEEHNNKNDLYE